MCALTPLLIQHGCAIPCSGACRTGAAGDMHLDAVKCCAQWANLLLLQDGGISLQSMVQGALPSSITQHLLKSFGKGARGPGGGEGVGGGVDLVAIALQ